MGLRRLRRAACGSTGAAPSASASRWRARMAYVPQIAPQLAAPVDEVVARDRARARPRAGAVARVGAARSTSISRRSRGGPFRSLSGGTKQKLLIALALASGASLLILDEPTGSLDARARERFFALFDALRRGRDAGALLAPARRDPPARRSRAAPRGGPRRLRRARRAALLDRCGARRDRRLGRGRGGGRLARSRAASGARRPASWHRTLPHAEKLKLLAEMLARARARLRNLSARDLEGIELAAPRAGGRDAVTSAARSRRAAPRLLALRARGLAACGPRRAVRSRSSTTASPAPTAAC